MNVRISTSMMFSQSVSTMLGKQAKMSHLQQQLSTGQRLVTAKDDPVAAGTGVGLDRALASLAQYAKNANNVQNRLGMQENTLQQAGEMLQRVNDLTIQANNGVLSNEDRLAISAELTTLRDSLLSLANSTDGTGRYLFAGTSDGEPPFAKVGGQVVYGGDQTQRKIEVAADTFVSDTLPGSEIFMRVRTGDGTVDATAATGNTGTGRLQEFGRNGASGTWAGEAYTISFAPGGTYQVQDSGGLVVSSGTHVSGEAITFGGLRISIDGVPEGGDSFAIGPASTRDVFSTLDNLIGALKMAPASDAERAAQQNALQSSMRDVTQATNRMIDARAAGGAQLAAIDTATELRASNEVTIKTTLSSIRDLDYAEAIGRYEIEKMSLQAAQSIFLQMQGMSLFNKIG